MTVNSMSRIAAIAALLAVAACEQDPLAVADGAGSDALSAALVGGLPDGAAFQVTVCKDGPAGTYNFTASTTTAPPAGTTTLPQGSSFTLTAGDAALECALVAVSTSGHQNVTVSEVPPLPANTLFDKIQRYRYLTSNNSLTLHSEIFSPSTTVGFGNDQAWVLVFVNVRDPSTGCTLTQGFWKNHPADWPIDPNTAFFSSGQSWMEVLNTSPKGNPYYILAHQYIAAYLNVASGAGAPTAVQDAMSDAEDYFNGITSPNRATLIGWAELLDSYNNGLTGPGHCGD